MQFFFIKNIPPCFLHNFLKNSKKYPIENKYNKHFYICKFAKTFFTMCVG